MFGHFLQFRKIEVSAQDTDYSLGPARAETHYSLDKYSDLICRREPDRLQSLDPSGRPKNSNSVAKTPETLQAREALRVMAQAGNPQKTAKN
jgi:hypothetical protein